MALQLACHELLALDARSAIADLELEGFDLEAGVLLRKLEAEGSLVVTPPQDYDDSYCIHYARAHGGCVMSNDLYRDQLQNAQKRGDSRAAIGATQTWLRTHVISFTFLGDELLPNPDFAFPAD